VKLVKGYNLTNPDLPDNPWVAVLVSIVIFLVVFSLQFLIIGNLITQSWLVYLLVALVIAFGAFLLMLQVLSLRQERSNLQNSLSESEHQVLNANRRLETVFQLSQLLVESTEESEVIDLILRLSAELSGAVGASLVPLDEHGHPMTAINYGDLPAPAYESWIEYLASPSVRHRCSNCSNLETVMDSCPLLEHSFIGGLSPSPPVRVYCLPLRRGEREFGILNIYLPEGNALDSETQTFLRTLVDETSLVLEGVRIQQREINALRQLRTVHSKTDLTDLLTNLVRDIRETLTADFVLLDLPEAHLPAQKISLVVGDFDPRDRAIVDGIIQAVHSSQEPVSLGELVGEPQSAHSLRALIASPLLPPDGESLGVILAGNLRAKKFTQRQLTLLLTVAGQIALVVQNTSLMAELEYQTMLAERTRLAREIHDGLAQTLGYLKLQTAQLKNFFSRGDMERLKQGLDACHNALVDAYEDARQTIDGLRIAPSQDGLTGWLEQSAIEFQENTGLQVALEGFDEGGELAPEVQAQLIRIVQEALSNARKHAQAQRVWVSYRRNKAELILEIRDDGRGFSPEDVPGPSRHGMRGMRERADLIGAEFQVISLPGEGTTIRVCVPEIIGERKT